MYDPIEITAKIELFKGKNVRQTPFIGGYRPLFDFSGAETKISGEINLINMDDFLPGMQAVVKVKFNKGIVDDSYFHKGIKFTFGEGQKDLGTGEILG